MNIVTVKLFQTTAVTNEFNIQEPTHGEVSLENAIKVIPIVSSAVSQTTPLPLKSL